MYYERLFNKGIVSLLEKKMPLNLTTLLASAETLAVLQLFSSVNAGSHIHFHQHKNLLSSLISTPVLSS